MDALWKISLWQQFGAAIDDLENAARAVNALQHAPCGRPCGPVKPISGAKRGISSRLGYPGRRTGLSAPARRPLPPLLCAQ